MIKNLTLLILSLLFFQVAKAQKASHKDATVSSADSVKNTANTVYAAVEREPEFAHGGAAGFNGFLAKNIKYPAYDKDNHVSGHVIITFVVEKDGTLSDVKTLRTPDKYIGEEVERVIRSSSPWTPGMQNGQLVRVQYTIAFAFSLANN